MIELINKFVLEGSLDPYCVFRVNGNATVTTEAEYKQIWGKYNRKKWETKHNNDSRVV